jgi:pimeloyl-ACP methyl ester carboxylesterase
VYLYLASVESNSDIYQIVKNSNFINNIPIHVIRAARSFINDKIPVTPTAPDLAKWFKKGRDIELKNGNHTFPLEEPEIVINFVKQMIEENKHLHSHL